jgi:hypothetical protein
MAVPPTSLPGSNGFLDTPPSLTISTSPILDNVLGMYSDVFSVLGGSNMFPQLADFDPNINDMDFSMTNFYFEHPVMDSDSVTHTLNYIGSLLIPIRASILTLAQRR